MQEQQYIQEDEIDLRELFKTLWDKKVFIIVFTAVVTIVAIIYIVFKNPVPVYQGSLMVEIGEGKSAGTNVDYIDNVNNLKEIIEKKYSVSVDIPKRTNKLIVISSSNSDKNKIKLDIKSAFSFVDKRHKEKSKLYEIYSMTKKVGDIEISNQPINKPKKKLIVVVAFVTGFILSIFLVFFMEFIKGFRQEQESDMKNDKENT